MLIGYARASDAEGFAELGRQAAALEAAGVDPLLVWTELASGMAAERPALADCLRELGAGDMLVVCRLERLARDLPHLVATMRALAERGAALRVLEGEGARIGAGAADQGPILDLLAALAEFERDRLRARAETGRAAARAQGRRGGGRRRMSAIKIAIAQRALARPDSNVRRLCRELGVSPQTLYRHVAPGGALREAGARLLREAEAPRG